MSIKTNSLNSRFCFLFYSNVKQNLLEKENVVPPKLKTEEKKELHKHHGNHLYYADHHWVLQNTNSTGLVGHYVCKHRRRQSCLCRARLNITCSLNTDERAYDRTGGEHTCGAIKVLTGGVVDIEETQREDVKENITTYVASGKSLFKVAKEIHAKFAEEHKEKATNALSVNQIHDALKNERRVEVGGDWRSRIMIHPLGSVSSKDTRYQTYFHTEILLPDKNGIVMERHTMVGFANPDILLRCRCKKIHGGVDGTFECIPHPFVQVVIVMGFDEITQTNMPIFFILLDTKKEKIYDLAFHAMMTAVGGVGTLDFSTFMIGTFQLLINICVTLLM
jgi:hypothetical protein